MRFHHVTLLVSGMGLTGCGPGDGPTPSDASGASASGSTISANAGSAVTGSGGSGGSDGSGGSAAVGGGGAACNRFVTGVIAHMFGTGQNFNQDLFPEPILGPPKGAGCCAGSLDVVSLGDGGTVTVEFAGNQIMNGPGPDFIVFENPFNIGGDPQAPYAELATIEVSEDGVSWVGFPCAATQYPYDGCAGWHPVLANAESNSIDPTDPAVAGGDAFDLADIVVDMARYVRITDRADLASVFDLDAVSIVHGSCP